MNPSFVELWVYLSATPLFGLTATLGVYLLTQVFYQRVDQAPWANPVLWSVLVIATVLVATRVPYPTYFAGAQFIHFLLGPAVVALGWPLWQRRSELRRRWRRVFAAALIGGAAASASAVVLGWAVGLPRNVVLSLVPKSVTVPVAMGIAEKIGGVPELAAATRVWRDFFPDPQQVYSEGYRLIRETWDGAETPEPPLRHSRITTMEFRGENDA